MSTPFIKKILLRWLPVLSVITFLFVWEMLVALGALDMLLVGSPSLIAREGYELFSSGFIWPHLRASIQAFVLGFVISSFLAVCISFFASSNKYIYRATSPYIYALTFLPMAAIVPLVIIWLGLGLAAKVMIISLLVAAPVLVNTLDGIKNVDPEMMDMARSFGASKSYALKSVVLPNSLPFIFSGLKVAVGRGLVGLVVSEIFGYGLGLGYLVSFYGATFNAPRLMFIVLLLAMINFLCISLISWAERKLVKWRT